MPILPCSLHKYWFCDNNLRDPNRETPQKNKGDRMAVQPLYEASGGSITLTSLIQEEIKNNPNATLVL